MNSDRCLSFLCLKYCVIYAQIYWFDGVYFKMITFTLIIIFSFKDEAESFYFFSFSSARDENEVALCIKDLNAPTFYPSMISIWLNDSFERKDIERELLTKLLINLTKSRDGLISEDQFIKG